MEANVQDELFLGHAFSIPEVFGFRPRWCKARRSRAFLRIWEGMSNGRRLWVPRAELRRSEEKQKVQSQCSQVLLDK